MYYHEPLHKNEVNIEAMDEKNLVVIWDYWEEYTIVEIIFFLQNMWIYSCKYVQVVEVKSKHFYGVKVSEVLPKRKVFLCAHW
jgi:hypothetical protein